MDKKKIIIISSVLIFFVIGVIILYFILSKKSPTPLDAAPTPLDAAPTPVEAAPTPLDAAPTPVEAAPTPVEAAPTPVEAAPTPVEAAPTEVIPSKPKPSILSSIITALSPVKPIVSKPIVSKPIVNQQIQPIIPQKVQFVKPIPTLSSLKTTPSIIPPTPPSGPTYPVSYNLMGIEGQYCSDRNRGVVCDISVPQAWEKFRFDQVEDGKVTIRGGQHNKYCSDRNRGLICDVDVPGAWEKFIPEYVGRHLMLKGGRNNQYCTDYGNSGIIQCNQSATGLAQRFKWNITTPSQNIPTVPSFSIINTITPVASITVRSANQLTQLWLSPNFNNGAYAELPIHDLFPKSFNTINAILIEGLYLLFWYQIIPNNVTKNIDVIFAVYNQPTKSIVLEKMMTSIKDSRNNTPISSNAGFNKMNITYQKQKMVTSASINNLIGNPAVIHLIAAM
jgi:hypothetical protein